MIKEESQLRAKTPFDWLWDAENHCPIWGLSAGELRTGWDEASVCWYQVEGKPLVRHSREFIPEWWGWLGLMKIQMPNILHRKNSKCTGPQVNTSSAYARNRKTISGSDHRVPSKSGLGLGCRVWYSSLACAVIAHETLDNSPLPTLMVCLGSK